MSVCNFTNAHAYRPMMTSPERMNGSFLINLSNRHYIGNARFDQSESQKMTDFDWSSNTDEN